MKWVPMYGIDKAKGMTVDIAKCSMTYSGLNKEGNYNLENYYNTCNLTLNYKNKYNSYHFCNFPHNYDD